MTIQWKIDIAIYKWMSKKFKFFAYIKSKHTLIWEMHLANWEQWERKGISVTNNKNEQKMEKNALDKSRIIEIIFDFYQERIIRTFVVAME